MQVINNPIDRCEVCGNPVDKRLYVNGKVVCTRHYRQYKDKGYFTDTSARTMYDMNEITINGDIALVHLYNSKQETIAYAMIDVEDIPKVQNIRWHLNSNGYASNNGNTENTHMHRVILGLNSPVDHINQNRLDNRKCNLRPITKSQNQMNNVNFKGYGQRPDGRFNAYIKLNQIAANLGIYAIEAEAAYARWYAERIVFKDFAPNKVEPIIPELRKMEIQAHVLNCIEKLFMKIGNYPFVRCNSLQEAMDCCF